MAELNNVSLINDGDLIAYWRFEGNNTATKGSITGADTSITYSNANGKYGQGIGVNGSTSKILLTDSGNVLNVATQISVSYWIKDYTTGVVLSNEYYQSGSSGTGWVVIGNGISVWGLESGSPDSKSITGDVNDGNWHHVVHTFNESTNQYYGYYDGDLQVSDNTTIVEDLEYKAGMYRVIGARYDYTGPTYASFLNAECKVDDLAVFDRVLTPAEVFLLYQDGRFLDLTSKTW